MKLATLKDSTRDGKLVVVSKDLTRCSEVGHIARTLQAALDDWAHVAPRLQRVALGVETGSQPTFRFHEHDAVSPLPRAYFASGSNGIFAGPREVALLPSGQDKGSASVQMAVIVNDVLSGTSGAAIEDAIVLVMLANRVCANSEGKGGVLAFSPVAVTPDELVGAEGKAPQRLVISRNGKAAGSDNGGCQADFSAAVAEAAAESGLGAGSIVLLGTGNVFKDLGLGDVVRVEANDATGHTIFGAIEQTLRTPVEAV